MGHKNVGDSSPPYQSRWMAHWLQRQNCQQHVASNKEHNGIKQGHLPVEGLKSTEALKVLSIVMETRNTSGCFNTPRTDNGKLNIASDIRQYAEFTSTEKGNVNIISNSVVRRNVSSFDSEAILSTNFSLQKLSDSNRSQKNLRTYHFSDSENISLELDHFPMFDINRKIESILAPKRKSSNSTISASMTEPHMQLNESKLNPHAIRFASEKHLVEARNISGSSDQGMRYHESIKGFVSYRDDCMDLYTEIHGTKCHRPNLRSRVCPGENNYPFNASLIHKKRLESTNLTYLNHELCNCSRHSTFMKSEMENDSERIAKTFESSWPKMIDGSTSMQPLRDSRMNDILPQFLSGECSKDIQNVSDTELHPFDISGIRQPNISAEIRGTAFFEIPATLYHHGQVGSLHSPDSSRNGDDMEEEAGIDPHFMQTFYDSTDKTDTMYISASQIPNPRAGTTSSNSKKDVLYPNLSRSNSVTNSSTQRPFFNSTCTSNRVLSPSKTESMDANHVSIHSQKQESNLNPIMESTLSPTPTSGRIKCFRNNPLDSLALSTKRSKTTQSYCNNNKPKLFSGKMSGNTNLSKHIEEQREVDNTQISGSNNEPSLEEQKAMHYWIQRWCRSGQQAAARRRPKGMGWPCGSRQVAPSPPEAPKLCLQENTSVLNGGCKERQPPSITGMARMVGVMTKHNPCKFRKEGSTVVWNIE